MNSFLGVDWKPRNRLWFALGVYVLFGYLWDRVSPFSSADELSCLQNACSVTSNLKRQKWYYMACRIPDLGEKRTKGFWANEKTKRVARQLVENLIKLANSLMLIKNVSFLLSLATSIQTFEQDQETTEWRASKRDGKTPNSDEMKVLKVSWIHDDKPEWQAGSW